MQRYIELKIPNEPDIKVDPKSVRLVGFDKNDNILYGFYFYMKSAGDGLKLELFKLNPLLNYVKPCRTWSNIPLGSFKCAMSHDGLQIAFVFLHVEKTKNYFHVLDVETGEEEVYEFNFNKVFVDDDVEWIEFINECRLIFLTNCGFAFHCFQTGCLYGVKFTPSKKIADMRVVTKFRMRNVTHWYHTGKECLCPFEDHLLLGQKSLAENFSLYDATKNKWCSVKSEVDKSIQSYHDFTTHCCAPSSAMWELAGNRRGDIFATATGIMLDLNKKTGPSYSTSFVTSGQPSGSLGTVVGALDYSQCQRPFGPPLLKWTDKKVWELYAWIGMDDKYYKESKSFKPVANCVAQMKASNNFIAIRSNSNLKVTAIAVGVLSLSNLAFQTVVHRFPSCEDVEMQLVNLKVPSDIREKYFGASWSHELTHSICSKAECADKTAVNNEKAAKVVYEERTTTVGNVSYRNGEVSLMLIHEWLR